MSLQLKLKHYDENIAHLATRGLRFIKTITTSVGLTGVHLLFWTLDKLILGPPHLRQYMQGGLFHYDLPTTRESREWVYQHSLWDTWNKDNEPITDNFLGYLLGFGTGLFPLYTITSHLLQSLWIIISSLSNATNNSWEHISELFGRDQRHWFVKSLMGLITLPFWLPTILVSNVILGCLYSIYHNIHSFWNATNNFWDHTRELLDQDQRHWFCKGLYGLLTMPLWVPLVTITNICSGIGQSYYLFYTALFFNSLCIQFATLARLSDLTINFNADQRPPYSKYIYATLLFPITYPIFVTLIAVGTIPYSIVQSALSCWYLTNAFMNATNQDWFETRRLLNNDMRGDFGLKVLFGMLTFPLWFPIVTVTNLAVGTALSVRHLIPSLFNASNETTHQINDRLNQDQRDIFWKVVYGLITSPLWLPIILITNPILGMGYSIKHLILDQINDVRQQDLRHRFFKILYGTLTLPLWFPCNITFYTVTLSQLGFENLVNPRRPHKWSKIILSFFTFPLWLPVVTAIWTLKNYVISVVTLISDFGNVTNRAGFQRRAMRQANDRNDTRPTFLKAIFGVLTLPIWLSVVMITNPILGMAYSFKNLVVSFYSASNQSIETIEESLRRDQRNLLWKIVCGLLTIPLWVPVTIITNPILGIFYSLQHLIVSFYNATNRSLRDLEQKLNRDRRDIFWKVVYGVITFPVWFPIIVVTNLFSGVYQSFAMMILKHGDRPRHTFFEYFYGSFIMIPLVPIMICGLALYNWLYYVIVPIIYYSSIVIGTILYHTILNFLESLYVLLYTFLNMTNKPWARTRELLAIDNRHLFWKVTFGLITIPLWLPIVTITNIIMGCYKTLHYQIGRYFNVMGLAGIFGNRLNLQDNRPLFFKIFYGLIFMPLWLPLTIVSNTVDFTLSVFYKYKMKIVLPVLTTIGFILSPIILTLTFIFKSSVVAIDKALYRGFYNVLYYNPIEHGPQNNIKTFVWGVLGLLTLGIVPAIRKFGKLMGWWGKLKRYSLDSQDPLHLNIENAKRGMLLHGEDRSGRLRRTLRLVGFRSAAEKRLKHQHNEMINNPQELEHKAQDASKQKPQQEFDVFLYQILQTYHQKTHFTQWSTLMDQLNILLQRQREDLSDNELTLAVLTLLTSHLLSLIEKEVFEPYTQALQEKKEKLQKSLGYKIKMIEEMDKTLHEKIEKQEFGSKQRVALLLLKEEDGISGVPFIKIKSLDNQGNQVESYIVVDEKQHQVIEKDLQIFRKLPSGHVCERKNITTWIQTQGGEANNPLNPNQKIKVRDLKPLTSENIDIELLNFLIYLKFLTTYPNQLLSSIDNESLEKVQGLIENIYFNSNEYVNQLANLCLFIPKILPELKEEQPLEEKSFDNQDQPDVIETEEKEANPGKKSTLFFFKHPENDSLEIQQLEKTFLERNYPQQCQPV